MGQRRVICPTHRERSRRLLGLPTLLDDREALTSSGIREPLSTITFSKLTIMQRFNIPRQSNVRQRKEDQGNKRSLPSAVQGHMSQGMNQEAALTLFKPPF